MKGGVLLIYINSELYMKDEFKKIVKRKKELDGLLGLLQWDLETQSPVKGREFISKWIGELSLESYRLTTSKEFIKIVETLKEKELDDIVLKKEVEELWEDIEKKKVIPEDEYRYFSELTARAQGIWEEAKEKNDFKLFAPVLKEIFEYNKRFIEYRGKKEGIYDQILADYEKGMNTEKLDRFFKELKEHIVPLLKEISEKNRSEYSWKTLKVSKEMQKEVSKELLQKIGFDFTRGIISESVHPFTLTVTGDDVRVTTKYIENDPFSSIFSSLHEGGHAIYEQGIDSKLYTSILGDGASMGLHESQSRFYENVIGRSKEFWRKNLNFLKEKYEILNNVELDEFYKGINRVSPSLIRVEADELTYSLHIMIRYEIEKGVIAGEYSIDELPKIWNEKMKEYLGVEPKTDSEGVLQDVHWSCGSVGYFPSYALGNVYSIQIKRALEQDLNLNEILENGRYEEIKNWLNKKIHIYGAVKDTEEIVKEVTGEGLNSKYYIEYLENKYREIYDIQSK